MKTALVALSLALLILTACAQKTTPMQPETPAIDTTATAQEAPDTEMAVNTIEQTSAQVDELSEEFDFTEFDQLDADLAAIDTLELG